MAVVSLSVKWNMQRKSMETVLHGLASKKALSKTTHIKCLNPDTTYCVRVKMINSVGESHPSDTREVTTTQHIPGLPQNLPTYLKLRWTQPAENPEAVDLYKVQSEVSSERRVFTTNKKSFKFENLKTNTKYQFCVCCVNSNSETGEWSKPIEAETLCGFVGRTIRTAGAFVGCTLAGPVLGAHYCGKTAGLLEASNK